MSRVPDQSPTKHCTRVRADTAAVSARRIRGPANAKHISSNQMGSSRGFPLSLFPIAHTPAHHAHTEALHSPACACARTCVCTSVVWLGGTQRKEGGGREDEEEENGTQWKRCTRGHGFEGRDLFCGPAPFRTHELFAHRQARGEEGGGGGGGGGRCLHTGMGEARESINMSGAQNKTYVYARGRKSKGMFIHKKKYIYIYIYI